MSQKEIVEYLKAQAKINKMTIFSTKEIAAALKVGEGSIQMNLKKLRKARLIWFRRTWLGYRYKAMGLELG